MPDPDLEKKKISGLRASVWTKNGGGGGGGGLPWVRYYYYYYYYSVFHDLDLPPFQNNVGVDPGVVTFRSSQYIKIEIDKNL